jgi:hypothetical protein
MKKLLLILLSTAITSFYAQNYQYLGNFSSNGTPLYLEIPGDIVSSETQAMISYSLPEGYPVVDYNPQYITSGYDTDIRLEDAADVWVTFVGEGAGYKNVLGFYTYDLANPITTAPNNTDITIIFPNVSELGSGGGLQMGDKVKIGSFQAGTGIGWVLLANAWSDSQQTVGAGLWKLYSNPDFNPEAQESLRYHNVLLADPVNERVILGFEDIRRDYSSCDNDFNDAIFYITANPYEAINPNNLGDISDANNVTSGNDGGLESNGSLASLIAKRNFTRTKDPDKLNQKELQPEFHKNQYSRSTSNSLIDYLPETGMYKTETANISSPNDLLGITNATEVFSVDYYQGINRVSAVLATKTQGTVYDHSKVICDRLNNSSLEDVRTVISRGHQIISSKIKRPNGEVENSLSFSIKLNSTENELFSFWNIDQYPEGDYQNFQIWGSSFSQVFSIANYIIDKHTTDNGLRSNSLEIVVPNVFVKSGYYSNGAINLQIINKTKETSIDFTGSYAETEVSDRNEITSAFYLTGNYHDQLTIETGVLFDIGFSLQTNNTAQKDVLYLADGPWGLDYLDEFATVNDFTIEVAYRDYTDDVYEVDRNASVSGEVKGNINLFRHLLPGDQTLNVAAYSFVNFLAINNQPVEIVIMPKEERDWENRIRYTIPANSDERAYTIPFSDFLDKEGNSLDISDIKTIVFSIIGDYDNYIPFDFSIKDLGFKESSVLNVNDFTEEENMKLLNYPNPFSDLTTIQLTETSEFVQIKVFDILGRVVDFKKIYLESLKRKVQYQAPQLKRGMYKYALKGDKSKIYTGTFMIK